MRAASPLLAAILAVAPAGCTIQRTPREPDAVTVTPPTEDGTRYVAVAGGPTASPDGLRRAWKRAAKKACKGEYMAIVDEPGQTRRAGLVTQRMHEGFVRCMVEEEELGGSPDERNASRTNAPA